jgi:hypothetical protein
VRASSLSTFRNVGRALLPVRNLIDEMCLVYRSVRVGPRADMHP